MRHLPPIVLALAALAVPAAAQRPLVGLGDSIGAGVQSANTSLDTQGESYLHLIAVQMGVPFRLPWVGSGPGGVVDSLDVRRRLFPSRAPDNLAVSGADAADLLNTAADAASAAQIDSETDLMLFPFQGSQLEIAESLAPELVICWIGNNDVLGAVTAFDELDASQMTSEADFQARFSEIAQRLGALGSPVAFGNIPDVTRIGVLVDRDDLIRLTGSAHGLAAGSYTSIVQVLLIRLGFGGFLINFPDYVLDPSEVAQIRARIDALNAIIDAEAAAIGMPVVDIHSLMDQLATTPLVVAGVPLTPRFLEGLVSLDGVHPSNFAHAIIANAFILTLNGHFGTSIPTIGSEALIESFLTDPFIDKDRDGVVTGRPNRSAVETLAIDVGVSGDPDDLNPAVTAAAVSAAAASGSAAGSTGAGTGAAPRDRAELMRLLRSVYR